MDNDDHFELADSHLKALWNHYHRQLDENRAVGRALDELRERVRELEDALITGANRPHQPSELVSS
jgi:tRNA A-37 threonylcarbamoyl transferase component Bud32